MRIGVVSDTHVPLVAAELPPEVLEAFQGVDLILHGGDIFRLSVLDELGRVAPVLAALGDDDPSELLGDSRVRMKHVLEVDGYRVWLMHERPWMYRMPARQQGYSPDVIVHGHTHDTEIREHGGVLFVGPGSPTFYLYRRGLGTIALLDIGPHGVSTSVLNLS